MAIVAVAGAADALLRCLHQTLRLARQTRDLTALSRTDPLTGLHNRRHVDERLAAAVSAARRHHQPLSVLFIDIDSFKRINDESSYEAGDDVLRTVGDRVRLALRTEDLVGRWGGEEFVAVLPATDLAGAVVVGERVRAVIASHGVGMDDRDAHVTVSVGGASGAGEPAELIRQASRALRQAKQAGKNRVVAADPPTECPSPARPDTGSPGRLLDRTGGSDLAEWVGLRRQLPPQPTLRSRAVPALTAARGPGRPPPL